MPDSGESGDDVVAFGGEVWTDARGYATVTLPREAGGMHANPAYELRPSTEGLTAEITAELMDGRFTIETDQPHVKVAWRVVAPRIAAGSCPNADRKEAQ